MSIYPQKAKRPALFLLLIAALCLIAGCAKDPGIKDFEKAEDLLSRGDYAEALKGYYNAANNFPASEYAPKSLYKTGLILNSHFHDRKRAVDAFHAVFYAYPDSQEATLARKELARIYSDTGDHQKALSEYQWLLKQSPAFEASQYKFRIAMEYVKMNDFRQARIEFDGLIKTTGNMDVIAEARFENANTYYLEGDIKTALQDYDEILAKFPDHRVAVDVKFNKAKALEETGRLAEALDILKKLLPDYPNKAAIGYKIQSIEHRLKEGTG